MTTHPTKPYVTKTGRVLTGADLDALADEVASDIDVATLKPRRRGRPPLAGGPADVVPIQRVSAWIACCTVNPALTRLTSARLCAFDNAC